MLVQFMNLFLLLDPARHNFYHLLLLTSICIFTINTDIH